MALSDHRHGGYLLDDPAAGLTVAVRGAVATITVSGSESPAVRRAVDDLARDFGSVCGSDAVVSATAPGAKIVVGTVGTSQVIDEAIARGALDISALVDEAGALRWEGFLVAVERETLYLVGADRRGTIYAVYDFAEAMGVSPWYWWADVPVRRRDHVTVRRDAVVADWPSVQYRGVFLNDEEELQAWAMRHTADTTIGPQTYARVYELLLRLKGNYLWPAMHVGAFNHDPENGRLAQEMGVIVGTSHCDMLLRSNEHEFGPWVATRPEPVAYDYSLSGRNRDEVREYWRGGIEQNGDYEVTWTVGMRGIHDSGFQTAAIDEDPALSAEQKLETRVRLLESIIEDQRAMLGEVLGPRAAAAPQIFIPYKEVLSLYDAGLRVPEDITLVWANDNYGYLRRLPDEHERARAGGNGLYYHSSYWAGYSTSYLATSSTPLALMKSELRRAWDSGIRKLWIDNIGGLKPLEHETEFFLRSAWEAGRETTTADVATFTAARVDAMFSGDHGADVADIYTTYYQLNNQRKIEHLSSNVFSQAASGDEAGRRLQEFRELYDRITAIWAALPPVERDAFFQLFAVKVHLAYLVNAQFVHADRSSLALAQGKAAAADRHAELAAMFDSHKRALLHFYNEVMADGRWSGVFTPEEFPPPTMALHPATSPALTIGAPGLGVVAWGDRIPATTPALTFWPYGLEEKWLETFNRGAGTIAVTIDADPWIEIDRSSDSVDTESRIAVRVDAVKNAGRSGRIVVSSPTTGESIEVAVQVALPVELPAGFAGVVESDGALSFDPSAADLRTPGTASAWAAVPYLGRYGTPAMQARGSSDPSGETGAELEFSFFLRTAGVHELEVHRLPTLDSTGRIRVAVGIDDHPSFIVESPTIDEHRGAWTNSIFDNVERLRANLPPLAQGPHVLRLRVVDDHFTLSKIAIFTADPVRSNLGPAYSGRVGRQPSIAITQDPDPLGADLAALDQTALQLYLTDPNDVPPRAQHYAGPDFWDGATTFRRTLRRAQSVLGVPRHDRRPDGTKDVMAAFSAGVIAEAAGRVAIEAEWALVGGATGAYATPGADGIAWTHTGAASDGASGLAMHVATPGLLWEDTTTAPGLHYQVDFSDWGTYRVWLLLKFDGSDDDSCVLALDGEMQPVSDQASGGQFCTYGARQVWLWAFVSELEIPAGRHTVSIFARKSGLRIDRLYLTRGDELPPLDADWRPSARRNSEHDPARESISPRGPRSTAADELKATVPG